jgi:hypothetical protein
VAINPDVYTLHAAAAECAMQDRERWRLYDGALDLLCNHRWEWRDERVIFAPGTPVDGELSRAATEIYQAAGRLKRGRERG